MKICVSAPDSKLANLAILRIAQYHINKHDIVKWYEPLFDQDADILYISKIFTFTDELEYYIKGIIYRGGTGYDVYCKLPNEIESITKLDEAYKLLYPQIDYSIIFTTRGCVRKCSFCVVPKKEGLIHNVPITSLNPNGTYIEVLDNNFFSKLDWCERLQILKSFDQPLNFNTGIDVRTITDPQAQALSTCKIKAIHIAWDNLNEEHQVFKGIETLIKWVSPSKITCYVLVGFETKEIAESDIYRVMKIHSYKITPFAMGYIDFDNPKHEKSRSVRDFSRWVNRHIFKKVKFEHYLKNIDIEGLENEGN
jgi:hypothetical protein